MAILPNGVSMPDAMYLDGRYLANNPTWNAEDSPWKAQHVARILERNNVHPNRVCEVGCGAGGVLSALQALLPGACEFSGYDISPQAIDLCKPKANRRLRFTLGSPVEDSTSSFDVILLLDVMEHVDDYFALLRSLRSKGQYLVAHVPLDLSVHALLRPGRLLVERTHSGHIHYFTRETALASLTDVGYKVLDHFYTAGAVDLPVKTLRSTLFKVPRKILSLISEAWAARLLGGYSLMVLAG
jgi:SAM-dependent methyltransferase